mmetsp:Transcript_71907/g.145504  ORF Transcript_71907/g.145504 Transcript_71907/m.145504 type:complete len:345 (+) Transcript_71907:128-1162(+)
MRWLWTFFSLPYLLDANVFRPNGDATAWLLWNHPTAIFDPPYCASTVTLMINDIVLMAQNVVSMTGDCMGDLPSPSDCAADISDFMANTLDAAQAAAALSMACAGEVTDCEQVTLDAAECFSSLASDLVGASVNCDIDAFLCTINLVDAMKHIFGAATDIDAATGSCPKETVLEHYLQLKYPDWAGWSWILPRLLKGNLTAGSTFFTSTTETPREASDDVEDKEEIVSSRYESFAGGGKIYKVSKGSASKIRPPSIGLVDETIAGPIIATDEPGMIRVGSALALENTHGLFNQGGNARQHRRLEISDLEAVVLPTLHDANAEVFFFMNYPREEISSAKLQTAYE